MNCKKEMLEMPFYFILIFFSLFLVSCINIDCYKVVKKNYHQSNILIVLVNTMLKLESQL